MCLHAGLASAKRIMEALDKKKAVEDNSNKKTLEIKKGQIKFENLCFSYEAKTSSYTRFIFAN